LISWQGRKIFRPCADYSEKFSVPVHTGRRFQHRH
jgi:hypothetical protein